MRTQTLYTIGRGRAMEGFLELLKVNEIEILVDVRSRPVSSHFPYFNQTELRESLDKADIVVP